MEQNFDDMSLLDIFKLESDEHIKSLNKGILELERDPADLELVDELMRIAHTLKGAARIVNNSDVQSIAHKVEDLFGIMKGGEIVIDSSLIDILFEALDSVEEIIESALTGGGHIVEVADLCRRLEDAQKGEVVLKRRQEGEKVCPAGEESEKKEDGTGELKEEKTAAKEENNQDKEKQRDGQEKKSPAKRRSIVEKKMVQKGLGDQAIRVDLKRLEKILTLSGEMYTAKAQFIEQHRTVRSVMLSSMESLRDQVQVKTLTERYVSKLLAGDRGESRLEMEQILDLIEKSYLFALDFQERLRGCEEDLDRLNTQFGYLVDDLQDEVMRSRMLPASTIFDPNIRFVRDHARENSKEIRVNIQGGDTLVDRNILELVKDPLMHLVRNACDHGIELPEERAARGKEREGVISLVAYQKGDRVIIEIEDDGQGIDPDTLRKTIVKKRLVSEEQSEKIPNPELYKFLFLPGFSTREKVSSTSGRGVGLDVVKNNLENVQGQVEVNSDPGSSTKFSISLPFTVGVNACLLVKSGQETFTIPLSRIEENITIEEKDIKTVEGRETIDFRGKIISLVHLGSLFQLEGGTPLNGHRPVVVLGTGEQMVGIVVDEFLGVQEVVVKALDRRLGKVQDIMAATIMANGEVGYILDVQDILRSVEEYAGLVTFSTIEESTASLRKNVLVVDDSLTIRELEKKVLLNAGYAVDTAVDGLDGLMKIRQKNYHLVLTDIDMPRMNGFDFIANLKKEEKHRDLPVIIVSYKEREEDKRRGMEVGASRYIVKNQFDNQALVETVNQLIG